MKAFILLAALTVIGCGDNRTDAEKWGDVMKALQPCMDCLERGKPGCHPTLIEPDCCKDVCET